MSDQAASFLANQQFLATTDLNAISKFMGTDLFFDVFHNITQYALYFVITLIGAAWILAWVVFFVRITLGKIFMKILPPGRG